MPALGLIFMINAENKCSHGQLPGKTASRGKSSEGLPRRRENLKQAGLSFGGKFDQAAKGECSRCLEKKGDLSSNNAY